MCSSSYTKTEESGTDGTRAEASELELNLTPVNVAQWPSADENQGSSVPINLSPKSLEGHRCEVEFPLNYREQTPSWLDKFT